MLLFLFVRRNFCVTFRHIQRHERISDKPAKVLTPNRKLKIEQEMIEQFFIGEVPNAMVCIPE